MTQTDIIVQDRPVKPAMWRGYRGKCPNCGEGPLMVSYLKVTDKCPTCREDFTAQRADDGPAYLTILIVGHLMGIAIHVMWVHWRPEPWVMATSLSVICVALSLYLLPRIKGAMVGLQWAKRMHGFGK